MFHFIHQCQLSRDLFIKLILAIIAINYFPYFKQPKYDTSHNAVDSSRGTLAKSNVHIIKVGFHFFVFENHQGVKQHDTLLENLLLQEVQQTPQNFFVKELLRFIGDAFLSLH